ncbi:MAG: DUF5676 family membrane protein [Pirellulaceae bacterium]
MKLDVRAAALAAASITALVYALCTAFCVLVPERTVVYVTTVFFHIDVSGLYRQITWGSFIASLLGWGLGTAVVAGAMAWLYNRLARTEAEKSQFAPKTTLPAPGELHEQR